MLNIITTLFKAIRDQFTGEMDRNITTFMRNVYPNMTPEGRKAVRVVMRKTV